MFKDIQTIFEYRTQPWSEIEKAILMLSDLSLEFGDKDDKNGVWYYASNLNGMLVDERDRADDFAFLDFDKPIISLLDSDLVAEFIKNFEEIEEILMEEEKKNKEYQNQILSNIEIKKLDSLCLRADKKNKWILILNNVDQNLREPLLKKIKDLIDLEEELYYQLTNIGAVLGLYSVGQLYSLDEIKTFLVEGGGEYSLLRLLRTFSEYVRDENRHDLVSLLMDLLNTQFYFEKDGYSWDDMIVITMMLHIVFYRFEDLTDENQIILVQYYTFRALLCGVSVRQKIQEVLYNTSFVVDYVVASMDFYQALENNQEKILVNVQNEEEKVISQLLKNYLALTGENFADGYKLTNYIDEVYNGQKYRGMLTSWLQEIFYIFIHLKNADLVDKNKGHELTEEEQYQNDMALLVAYFMIGEDGKDFIKNYFLGSEKKVSILGFINGLKKVVDLKDDLVVENISILLDVLKENNLLSDDQEIIIFNEELGEFEFNNDLKV